MGQLKDYMPAKCASARQELAAVVFLPLGNGALGVHCRMRTFLPHI